MASWLGSPAIQISNFKMNQVIQLDVDAVVDMLVDGGAFTVHDMRDGGVDGTSEAWLHWQKHAAGPLVLDYAVVCTL